MLTVSLYVELLVILLTKKLLQSMVSNAIKLIGNY